MRIVVIAFALLAGCLFAASPARAQLEQYKDYTVSDAVWNITTVKVNSNMEDDYLEGLRSTWIASNEVAKKMGHIEDYKIYASELGASGDWNMILVTKFKNTSDLAPNKKRYEEFMAAWGTANEGMVREKVKDYPSMRTITGEYLVREVSVTPAK